MAEEAQVEDTKAEQSETGRPGQGVDTVRMRLVPKGLRWTRDLTKGGVS